MPFTRPFTRPMARSMAWSRPRSAYTSSSLAKTSFRPRPAQPMIHYRQNSSVPPRSNVKTKVETKSTPDPSGKASSLRNKISRAWSTPTEWYPIPFVLGALVLLGIQYRKQSGDAIEVESQRQGAVVKSTRKVDGPWQVRVLGALPLRSLSQLWGYLNSLVLPVWFRPYGFKLYAAIFGCNLDEVPLPLETYASLGEFFYREIKEGARPIAQAPMVSPADGRVLHFGEIVGQRVEQVKGITYSLQALLGVEGEAVGKPTEVPSRESRPPSGDSTPRSKSQVVDDEQFAEINHIHYSLGSLLGGSSADSVEYDSVPLGSESDGAEHDASRPPVDSPAGHDINVAMQLGTEAMSKATQRDHEFQLLHPDRNNLYFCVIYLAPGDYHRFHSPVPWIVERRRHFTGDLFSVSPYIVNRLKDLFVLNERVALLGRWKHGFFSMVPVGATNVGSIVVNFDENLRTNTRKMTHPPQTFTEAVYTSASAALGGQPLLAGEEMGGFKLGSTIVLVFEAPKDWRFTVKAGDKVKVGEKIGEFASDRKEKDD